MKSIIKDISYILLVVALVNVLSCFIFFRLDFTTNKRYSLSKVSKSIVRSNQKPIIVDFYVSEHLPQDMKKLSREFQGLLKEYKSLNNNSFTINIIYPDNNEKENAAIKAGVIPIYKETRERDQEKIQKIFIGASFKVGKKQSTLPVISYDTPLEYEITRILKQTSDTIKPTVGFIWGHGEAAPNHIAQLTNELFRLTHMTPVNLNFDSSLREYNVICIIDPKDTYSPQEIQRLEEYLSQGGRLFIALNHAIGQLDNEQHNGFINRTGIEDMLEKMGLKIKYDFVVDNNCGTIAITQQYGSIQLNSNVSFPYIPIITNFSKHPITMGLKSMLLPFASSIVRIKTPTLYIYTSLAQSSSISGLQQAPLYFDLQKQWTHSDFSHPHNTVAALLTNADNNSAIVTITDADFLSNKIISSGHTDNINFAINSIEWLADNSGLIQLRNKFTTYSSLEPVEEHTKESLKYINFFLPILLTMAVAIIRYRHNQRKRINRSHPGYID